MIKETLLMIPGTLCDALLFETQIKELSDIVKCQVADHSNSDDLKEVAANILSETKGNLFVIGLSYGGIIAFEMWRQAKDRIKSLILLNTNYRLPSESTKVSQQRFVGMSYLGEFREIMTDILKDAMMHPEHAKDPKLREVVLKMAMNTGQEAFLRQIKAQLGRPDSTKDLPDIECPTLVMTGREDKVCTVELHEEMAALIPNSQLEIIEHCGHLSTLEQPEKVTEKIREFLLNTFKHERK